MSTLLSIIIVSYNTQDLTLQALKSCLKDLRRSKLTQEAELLVVDNHSSDDSLKMIRAFFKKENFKNFKLLSNQENLGFAKANNLALAAATGQYFLLLNSDTIVQPGAFKKMINAFERAPKNQASAQVDPQNKVLDQLGILSATLLNPDGSIQAQGGSKPSLLAIFNQMFFLDDLPLIGKYFPSTQHTGLSDRAFVSYDQQQSELIRKDWVGGTAMMISRQVLDAIGDLDSNIFMYGEDQEYCLRAKNHHFDIAIHPQAQVIHLGNASSSSKNAIVGEFKGYLYIWKKHFPHWQLPILKGILRAGALIRIIIYTLIIKKSLASAYRAALAAVN